MFGDLISTGASFLFFPDQTPTPTKFLKYGEEIGLFNELKQSPFDEAFKKAMSSMDELHVSSRELSSWSFMCHVWALLGLPKKYCRFQWRDRPMSKTPNSNIFSGLLEKTHITDQFSLIYGHLLFLSVDIFGFFLVLIQKCQIHRVAGCANFIINTEMWNFNWSDLLLSCIKFFWKKNYFSYRPTPEISTKSLETTIVFLLGLTSILNKRKEHVSHVTRAKNRTEDLSCCHTEKTLGWQKPSAA